MSYSLSGSKLPLAMHCTYWLHLPQEEPRRSTVRPGELVHQAIEATLTGNIVPLDPALDIAAFMNWAAWWGKRPGTAYVEREAAFVYDYATERVRRVFPAKHREYGEVGPTEVPTTLDCWVEHEGTFHVFDWKYVKSEGRSYSAERSAKDDVQTLFQALCVWTYLGRPKTPGKASIVKVSANGVSECPEGGYVIVPDELEALALTLQLRLGQVDTVPTVGRHCTRSFCPSRKACDAYQERHK